MSEEDLLKVAIGLASAFAGWMLAQLTSGIKTWFHRKKVRKLLLEELSDLDKEVNRLFFFYSRQLQIYGSNSISSETAVGLTNPIYTNYYKDALLSLNQKQRISFQLIHSLVAYANLALSDLRKESSDIYTAYTKEGLTEDIAKACDSWGKTVKSQYIGMAILQWQIRFHLQHPSGPDLAPNTQHHDQYLRHLQSAENAMEAFIQTGSTIDPSKFNQIYNPTDSGTNNIPKRAGHD